MTFSRLTLGEPRLKSKLRGGSVETADPCSEDLIVGSNIITDSGFEDSPTAPNGVTDEDFPFAPGTEGNLAAYWLSDNSYASEVPETVFWGHRNNQGIGLGDARLSSVDPHSGSKHAVIPSDGFTPNDYVTPLLMETCDLVDGNDNALHFTGRVDPGYVVDASGYIKKSGGTATYGHDFYIDIFDSSANFVTRASSVGPTSDPITTAYVQRSVSIVAPASAVYFLVYFGMTDHGLGGTDGDIYIDTTSVGVTE